MEENVIPVEETPLSVADIVSGLKGFGVQDFEEILTIEAGGRKVALRISNLPTDEEMNALLATEELKGRLWLHTIKAEVLSRAITYIDGITISRLTPLQRMLADPTDKNRTVRDIQVVLRNLLLGWGQEVLGVLWRVLMTHCQNLELRLINQFPDAAIFTEYEKRFLETAMQQIEEENARVIKENIEDIENESAGEEK